MLLASLSPTRRRTSSSKNFVLCFRALSLLVAWLPFLRSHLYIKSSQAHIIDNEKMHILIQRHLGCCLCPFVWCVRLSEGQEAVVRCALLFGRPADLTSDDEAVSQPKAIDTFGLPLGCSSSACGASPSSMNLLDPGLPVVALPHSSLYIVHTAKQVPYTKMGDPPSLPIGTSN
jgi:hypothetical protein